MMNGKKTMFIDQYGHNYWATTIAGLKSQIPGKVSKLFIDKKDGSTWHTGYVVGQFWLTAFRPVEIDAS